MPSPRSGSDRHDSASQRLWQLSGMGAAFASEVIAGGAIGWGVDLLLDTFPTCLIVGTIAGLIVAMTTFIRTALKESSTAGRDARHIAHTRELHTFEDEESDDDDEYESSS